MKKTAIAFIIMTVMILASAQPALSRGCQEPGTEDPIIVVDKSAKGTKLTGPLTIYYEFPDPDNHPNTCNMYIFTRLTKGNNHYPFSGIAEGISYNNIGAIQEAINNFFELTVIPILFGLNTQGWALKSVDKIVEPDSEGVPPGTDECCQGMRFTILDVVFAVDE